MPAKPAAFRTVAIAALVALALSLTTQTLANAQPEATAPGSSGGSPEDDVLTGTPERDHIDAFDGSDRVSGLGSADVLFGGFGQDRLYGGAGSDHIYGPGTKGHGPTLRDNGDLSADSLFGGLGEDHLVGGGGPDTIRGGRGADEIHDGAAEFSVDRARDVLSGGPGDDILVSEDRTAARDRIICGAGFDRAYADHGDRISADCERVQHN